MNALTPKEEHELRREFQHVKGFNLDQFRQWKNSIMEHAYHLCEKEYSDAMDIALPPRYHKKVEEAVTHVRTDWDGIQEVKEGA